LSAGGMILVSLRTMLRISQFANSHVRSELAAGGRPWANAESVCLMIPAWATTAMFLSGLQPTAFP
jgi:hypothetical protein